MRSTFRLRDLAPFASREILLETGDQLLRIAAIAALAAERVLVANDVAGIGGNRVQVFGKRRAVHRREGVVAENEVVGIGPIGRDPLPRKRRVAVQRLAVRDEVKSVHASAVDRLDRNL
jgi:hypothetical protein